MAWEGSRVPSRSIGTWPSSSSISSSARDVSQSPFQPRLRPGPGQGHHELRRRVEPHFLAKVHAREPDGACEVHLAPPGLPAEDGVLGDVDERQPRQVVRAVAVGKSDPREVVAVERLHLRNPGPPQEALPLVPLHRLDLVGYHAVGRAGLTGSGAGREGIDRLVGKEHGAHPPPDLHEFALLQARPLLRILLNSRCSRCSERDANCAQFLLNINTPPPDVIREALTTTLAESMRGEVVLPEVLAYNVARHSVHPGNPRDGVLAPPSLAHRIDCGHADHLLPAFLTGYAKHLSG